MFQTSISRLATGAPIAALVVFGLYSFMSTAIAAEPVRLESKPIFVIDRITPPPEPDLEPQPPQPEIDFTAAPPPDFPPVPSPDMGDVTIEWTPTSDPIGDIPQSDPRDMLPGPVVVGERRARAIVAPAPVFPGVAISRGISGTCEVRFSLTVAGEPFNVVATCSDRVFEREARRSVSRARFAPEVRGGQLVESHGLVYPMEFNLDD